MNSLFKNKKFSIQPAPAVVRTERIRDTAKPAPLPSKTTLSKVKASRSIKTQSLSARSSPSTVRSSSATPSDQNDWSSLRPSKRKASRQRSPARVQRLESDSDDDASISELEDISKRQKLVANVDTNRRLRSTEAFSESDEGHFDMIHAADIGAGTRKMRSLEHQVAEDTVTVRLQYPSASQRERYELLFEKDRIDPTQEIIAIATIVAEVYLTHEQAKSFNNPQTGIVRRLERARNLLSRDVFDQELLAGFEAAVNEYNSKLDELVKDGAVGKMLDSMHSLPLKMVLCILQQVYDRAVSPQVDLVRKYEPASDNIYGELLPPFVSRILHEAGLKSDHVFVDMGSGVGSVVLQAALEFGCESWGCEMMENASTLAAAQEHEFRARCRLWGIKPGAVTLETGDFLENKAILKAMKRADVILVNNQAFGMQLNRNLIDLFLDLKNGCKIISLVNFVDRKLSSRTIDDPANLLDVKKGEYHSNSVSWTDAGGNYYIATKDQKRLKAFST